MTLLSSHRFARSFARGAVAVSLAAALQLALVRPASADPVDVLYEEGVAAAQAGQREIAYEKLKAAWALRQTYDIAAALAVVENALGKHRDAAEHFQFVLDNFPPVGDQGERAKLQAGLDSARKKVGELTITVAAGSVVEVNGRVVGTAPLKSPVFVDPGQATVNCKKKDFGEGKALVEVRIGEAQEVKVEITLTTGGGSTGSPLPVWPGLLVGGVGLVGVGVGVGLFVEASSAADQADELTSALPSPGACLTTPAADSCATIQDKFEAHDALGTGAVAAFAVGGALLVTGVVLFAVSMSGDGAAASDEAPSEPTVTAMAPWFTSDAGGFVLGGQF